MDRATFTVALVLAACQSPAPITPPAPDAEPAPHCRVLRDRLCAQFGQASDVCTMAAEQTKAFSLDRCAAMLARYPETAASALRFASGKQALTAREQGTPHGPAPSLGPDDAPLTMVVFSDLTDHACGRASPMATTIRNLYADKLRLVFRQFPLATHPHAHLAAEASLAAHAQGRFWAFHDVIFGNPQAHDRAALERYAKTAGLDLARFRAALDHHTFAADVAADLEIGRELNVDGVPALFVNGRRVPVPYGADELARLVEMETRRPP